MWPQPTHMRRCTQVVPSRRQSPHSPGVSGSTAVPGLAQVLAVALEGHARAARAHPFTFTL